MKSELFRVNAAYEWMQEDGQLPAPTDFNPFKKWLKKGRLSTDHERTYERITLDEFGRLFVTSRIFENEP